METRNISLTLEEAKEWYNSNIILRDVALKAFTKEELEASSFKDIKSFKDACKALNLNYGMAHSYATGIAQYSRASAAMFKLNIIRKALNLGQDLHLTKNSEHSHLYYCPFNPFITKDSYFYEKKLNSGKMEIIGKIKSEGREYNVLGGSAFSGDYSNLGCFDSSTGKGLAHTYLGFLGCATEEIAKHFSKYFGMLITEAKYGDLPGFEVIISLKNEK